MFGWLARLFSVKVGRPASTKAAEPTMSEARWQVSVDNDEIAVTAPDGERKVITRSDLAAVVIETNDTGPWGADLWWFVAGKEPNALAFPQGATGEEAAVDWLSALPGFDHEAMIQAMSSTENARFPCWRAAEAG